MKSETSDRPAQHKAPMVATSSNPTAKSERERYSYGSIFGNSGVSIAERAMSRNERALEQADSKV